MIIIIVVVVVVIIVVVIVIVATHGNLQGNIYIKQKQNETDDDRIIERENITKEQKSGDCCLVWRGVKCGTLGFPFFSFSFSFSLSL